MTEEEWMENLNDVTEMIMWAEESSWGGFGNEGGEVA